MKNVSYYTKFTFLLSYMEIMTYPCCLTGLRVSEDVDRLRWFLPFLLLPGLDDCWPVCTLWSKVGLFLCPLNVGWAGVDEREPPEIKSKTSIKMEINKQNFKIELKFF